MKPWLMLSLPNNGSDWLAPLLARHIPGSRYFDKEYFNPLCNWPIADKLANEFGCEAVSCQSVLKDQFDRLADIEAIVEMTWGAQTEWNCNKEVWSPLLADQFRKFFRIVGLVRSTENTFPPSRARVWAWYDAMWHGFMGHWRDDPGTFADRAIQAHSFAMEELLSEGKVRRFPVLVYDTLVYGNKEEVVAEVGKLEARFPDLNRTECVLDILTTRNNSKKR